MSNLIADEDFPPLRSLVGGLSQAGLVHTVATAGLALKDRLPQALRAWGRAPGDVGLAATPLVDDAGLPGLDVVVRRQRSDPRLKLVEPRGGLDSQHDLRPPEARRDAPERRTGVGDQSVSNGSNSTETAQRKAETTTEPVAARRLARARYSFVVRRFEPAAAMRLITAGYTAQAGDLVLARVESVGRKMSMELANGRSAVLRPGDEVVVVQARTPVQEGEEKVGDSDAADSAQGSALRICCLVSESGLIADCSPRDASATGVGRLEPLGVLASSEGRALNLAAFRLPLRSFPAVRPTVTAVVAASATAGGTAVVTDLVRGMTRQGLRVGVARVTGTAAGADLWRMQEAGCKRVLDFTDCGFSTSHDLSAETLESIAVTLVAEQSHRRVDAIVVEVADGISHREHRELLCSPVFTGLVDNVLFAADDAVGAVNGVDWLADQGLNVVGLSGAMTASPRATHDCVPLTDLPVVSRGALCSGRWLPPRSDAAAVDYSWGTVGTTWSL